MQSPPRPPLDRLGRPPGDLRLSLTDRCNFRCGYCMPRERFGPDFAFLPKSEILTFEEIARVVEAAVALGVRKVRLTGGEPLLRRDLPVLVGLLRAIDASLDLALTTNGSLLAGTAEDLARAGLGRLNVSLDTLDEALFRRMNDAPFGVGEVLAGIAAAERAGLAPIKVNCVVRRGWNESSAVELVRHFHGSGHVVRFIEYMDVGGSNDWRLAEVVPAAEIVAAIDAVFPLEPLERQRPGEVAERYRLRDGGGEIGLVASVTRPFCGDCNRLRLSAEGKLYTCLFASAGADLRAALRGGATTAELIDLLARVWRKRQDRYSEQRADAASGGSRRIEMSYIGG